MSYDPRQDPRYIDDGIDIDDQLISELAKLPLIGEMLALFDTPAWQEVTAVLDRQYLTSRSLAIASRSMEELQEHRGKIKGLLTLLSLPAAVRLEQTRLLELSADISLDAEDEEE